MEKAVKGSITAEQRKELVDYIKIHPQLNSGKFTNEFTFKKAQELWQTLAINLNALPGANKDWKKWRKTWHDIKTRTKSKSSTINQHRRRTGGGPPININITDEEKEVLGIMGKIVVEGHPGIQESLVEFDDNTSKLSPVTPVQVDKDHNYAFEILGNNYVEVNTTDFVPVADENDPPLLELPIAQSKSGNSGKTKDKRPRRIQRLEKTISATAELAKLTERDIAMRESYYIKKNELYEMDVNAKLRIASALERIAKCKENKNV